MPSLKGQRVLITGASRGIGAGCAKAFAKAGAIPLLAARTESKLQKVKAEIEAAGGQAEVYPVDLASRKAVRDLAKACGHVDVLINNAALTKAKFQICTTVDDEYWDETFQVSFMAPLILIQELAPAMVKQNHGVILNMSSMAAQRGIPYHAAYSVIKCALDMLSRCAGMELAHAKTGIRVNGICLGHIDTEAMQENTGAGMTVDDVAKRNTPLQRIVAVSEVADLCVYLSSDSAKPILGTIINIDGGMLAGQYSFVHSFGDEAHK